MDYHEDQQAARHSDSHHHFKLACQACQRRKIKCDRVFPCGPCTRSALQCVPSQRKARARHAGKRTVGSELLGRIAKLESLVESLSGEISSGDTPEEKDAIDTVEPVAQAPAGPGKYTGNPFWSSLSNEVQGLRDALEGGDSDEDKAEVSPQTAPTSDIAQPVEFDLLLCPPASVYIMPGALAEPVPAAAAQLYEVFFKNVDPVFKIFHRPSLERFLYGGGTYMGQDAISAANRALKCAVWFAAIVTLRDDECMTRFGVARVQLLQTYRRHVDVALAQADLLNTNDIATLQAFVTYNATSRITDPSRRTWTLTATFIRIARAMGLDHDSSNASIFEREIRRRMWHTIRILDIYASVDRGTAPLIAEGTWTTPFPKNANDDEFDERSTSIADHDGAITDSTFPLLCCYAADISNKLLSPDTSSKGDTWQVRLETALSFGNMLQDKFLQHADKSKPLHRLICAAGKSMAASSNLRAVRPIQRHVSSKPPPVDSRFVLQIAIANLRESEAVHDDPECQGYRWMFWTQWHALAVALAGLCTHKDDDISRDAWPIVERTYRRQLRYVADSRHGKLWRPIEKLYKKAAAFGDGVVISHRDSTSSASPQSALPTSMPISATAFSMSPLVTQLPAHVMPGMTMANGNMSFPTSAMMNLNDSPVIQNGDFSWMDWEMLNEEMNNNGSDQMIPDLQMSYLTMEDWAKISQSTLL